MISRKLDRRNLDMTIECLRKLPILYRDFFKLVRSYRPDVIYAAGYHELILLWPALLACRIPVVYHVHGLHSAESFQRRIFSVWGAVVDHYIAVAENVGSTLLEFGVESRRISILHNGVDLSQFKYAEGRSLNFSTRFGWPEQSIIVGMTGHMTPGKGHLDFLEAARLMSINHPEVRFVIGGKQEGPHFRELQEMVSRNKMHEIIGFSGWQDDMTSFYCGIDIFVLPSRWAEGLPLVVAEAMARGLPVVATRSGGVTEIVEDGNTGFLVEKENPRQLIEAISSLLTARSRRVSMGIAGRRRVEQFFDLSQQSARLEAILESVAKLRASYRLAMTG
jgi:glycosyltransferase involved in cell wall biosynthesis